MSLQWSFAAAVLYTEIGLLILLSLPFISYNRWHKLLTSRLIGSMAQYGSQLFIICIAFLFLLLADSTRDMWKNSNEPIDNQNPTTNNLIKLSRLHRAQRNYYITGFSLLCLVFLRRVMNLISKAAVADISREAVVKQAENASQQCRRLMDENEELKAKSSTSTDGEDDLRAKYQLLQKELQDSLKELEKYKINLEAVKQQAEGTNREYDRLLVEHAKLQSQLNASSADVKKDD